MSLIPINPYGRPVASSSTTVQQESTKPDAGSFARRTDGDQAKGVAPAPASSSQNSGTSEKVADLIKQQRFQQALREMHQDNAKAVLPNGETLLHRLVEIPWGDVAPEIAEKLVGWGASVNAPTPDGETPLRMACKVRNAPAVLFLARHNAALMR